MEVSVLEHGMDVTVIRSILSLEESCSMGRRGLSIGGICRMSTSASQDVG